MPYIDKDRRSLFDQQIEELANSLINNKATAGDINYSITKLFTLYTEGRGMNYQLFNDLIGALEGVKLEMYRREVAPYEDKKLSLNGDYKPMWV